MTRPASCDQKIPAPKCRAAETPASTRTEERAGGPRSTSGRQVSDRLAQELGAGSAAGSLQIRDRIKEFTRVCARDLIRNPKNWKRHPKSQIATLSGLLADLGFATALPVRRLPDGRYVIIDGHLRAEIAQDAMVPVLVLDVTEEEADKLPLTLDPSAAMAQADADRISQLLKTVRSENQAVEDLFRRTAGEELWRNFTPMKCGRRRSQPIALRSSEKGGGLKRASFGRSARTDSSARTALARPR